MAAIRDVEKAREGGEEVLTVPFLKKEKNDGDAMFMVFLSTAVAVSGSFAFGTSVGYSSPAQYPIMGQLGLSYSEAMRLSSIICIGGWLSIALAMSPVLLYFGRFLVGYGIGIISYVLLIVIGLAVCYTVGAFVGWRILALAGIIPCVILFFGLFIIPESPRWLAISGQEDEFEAALRKLRGPNADISKEADEIKENIAALQQLPKVTVLNLFDKANCQATIIAVGLMAFQQFVGINGIVFYASKIFKSAGFDPDIGSIAYSVLQVVVTGVGAMFMDKAGRRPLLLMSASGLLLGNLMIALSFLLQAYDLASDWVPYLAVVGVLVYIFSFSVGMGAGPWLIMSEVFPLHVKGMGGGLVTLMNWFGSWAVSFSFNFLMLWSSYGTFLVYATICVLAIIFIFKLVPETKGRSLEEIHASLSSSSRRSGY
ncbi:hypothetical protein M9H77_27808 [Catharanthus roseus]|uniref:Uncharacterized protein n=1 Tax=Catharanthus roseus TaxID=4058 RepID=A0ACC0AFF9_CATRO|nr:hypothetical protein M9H77_27808 [Catharanthus roseus]